jgi:hypothetical protein
MGQLGTRGFYMPHASETLQNLAPPVCYRLGRVD